MHKKFWFICSVLILVLVLAGNFWYVLNSSYHPLFTNQPLLSHDIKRTLLASYKYDGDGKEYAYLKYRPRQWNEKLQVDFYPNFHERVTEPGEYKGWDVLNTPRVLSGFTLKLNRPAILAVVYRGDILPAWLSGWKKAGRVSIEKKTYPAYTKLITQKEISLGTDNYSDRPYVILLAEQNGKPSQPPAVPQGLAIPYPNRTCPSWVHDQYKVVGQDGKTYPTWHPQIDPVYWCYFNHEHGSKPALFDQHFAIPFGVAGANMGMHEAHVGFKVYVWDDQYGYRWLALQHQGTSTNQAACGRFHELDIASKDKKTGEILSEQYFVGDYGISRPLDSNTPLRPVGCPNQDAIEKNNIGARFLPIVGHGHLLEEPWTVNNKGIIGFDFESFTINTLDPARMCNNTACDKIIYTGQHGTNRYVSYVKGFGPKSGTGHTGIYYTDPTGTKLLHPDDPNAMRQYIKPWTSLSSDIPYISTKEASCRDVEGSGDIFQCGYGLDSISTEREASIKIPN